MKIFTIDSNIVKTNTLSPNGKFYYKIKYPEEVNKAAYGCEFMFFSINNKLLYYQHKSFALELHTHKEIETKFAEMQVMKIPSLPPKKVYLDFVWWSMQGNIAYIVEYYNNKNIVVLESVFIDLLNNYCYRIDENIDDFKIIRSLLINNSFDEEKILASLKTIGIKQSAFRIDKAKNHTLMSLVFKTHKWYP